ncbi:hypothetical protein [Paenibacillus lactis]|uniref:hypothetical protein n=1 Tax=Paenibacillus lactis TaxID=228574 RepID=UPI003D73CFE5
MVDDIKKKIFKHYNSITELNICKLFAIAINRRANIDYQVFEMDGDDYRQNTFERLSDGDICSVDIVFDDGSEINLYVDWSGESEFINDAQDTYISELGDLFIVVSKKEKVDSYFENWRIDKPGIIDMMWDFK